MNNMIVKAAGTAEAIVERGRPPLNNAAIATGVYDIEHWRNGLLIGTYRETNTVTTEGLRYLLDAALDDSAAGYTEKTTWYVSLVNFYVVESATYTYDYFYDSGQAPTTATESNSYSGGVRPTWTGVLDGSGSIITNSAAKATFNMTGTDTIWGACLVSNSTLTSPGHHASGDYMMSYSLFASSISAENGDTLKVTVTITLA
jgi:hypothetical protein